jgi:hypothetical protein
MTSTSEKRFIFSKLLNIGNSQKPAGAKSGQYGGCSMADCDNRGEEYTGYFAVKSQ